MDIQPANLIFAIAIGIGATVVLDLWAFCLRRAFNVPSPNYCLVGRWLRYIPSGIFMHRSIVAAPRQTRECLVGWFDHYALGAIFAIVLSLMSPTWLQRPTVLPPLLFGVVTVVVPFFVMHPSFGLGIASSKAANPAQARLRSLLAHTVFGFGLYISALALSIFV